MGYWHALSTWQVITRIQPIIPSSTESEPLRLSSPSGLGLVECGNTRIIVAELHMPRDVDLQNDFKLENLNITSDNQRIPFSNARGILSVNLYSSKDGVSPQSMAVFVPSM